MKTKKTIFTRRGLINETPRVKELRNLRISYYSCLANALRETADDEQIVCLTARACRQAQLPEEPCVQRTIDQDRIALSADEVRKIFRAAYTEKGLKPRSVLNQKERIARGIADFFSRRYELRYNTVKKIEEWRPHDGVYHEWQQLTDRDLNRMTFEQMNEGGDGWGIDLQLYLHSTMIPQYNPLTEFLDGCGRWYGQKDHIADLALRIPTDYADWEPLFHRWFLAMVAQWLGIDSRFSNMLVPMLIGGQGTHKTTFCRMLLPPVLSDYFIDDIKMDNAEQVERVLARMALVNIDEYNAKTEREQAKIKRILAEKDVQVRKMHSDQYVRSQRTASFIATTNSPTPLTDPTGSRRYICCPVNGIINTEPTINYRQLYAQAVYEVKHGARYYPTHEEEQRMEQHNKQFQMMKKAEFVITEFFERTERNKDSLMTLSEVERELHSRVSAVDMPSFRELSAALANHYQAGAVDGRRGWYMCPKE
ncbi:MAG: hypothetical protein IJ929_08135 [Prevotella sp.]|nr:hypothetical protein [Prevotella sp.]